VCRPLSLALPQPKRAGPDGCSQRHYGWATQAEGGTRRTHPITMLPEQTQAAWHEHCQRVVCIRDIRALFCLSLSLQLALSLEVSLHPRIQLLQPQSQPSPCPSPWYLYKTPSRRLQSEGGWSCWSCWVAVGAGCAVVPSHNPHDCVCRVATPGTAFALHRWRTSEPLDTFVLGRVSRLFFYRVGVAAGAPRMLSRSGGNLKGHMCHQTTFKIRLDGAWGPAGTRGLGRGSWVVGVGAQYVTVLVENYVGYPLVSVSLKSAVCLVANALV
jgi:hypothetical protein